MKAPTLPVLKFLTYPVGQGVVFNVIVYDPDTKKEAAYSPVASYACVGCHQHSKFLFECPDVCFS